MSPRVFFYQSPRTLAMLVKNSRDHGLKWADVAALFNAKRLRRPRHNAPWTRRSVAEFYHRQSGKPHINVGRPRDRPRTPDDCKCSVRPCPFASCRYHMAILHIRVDAHDTRPESEIMAAVEGGDFSGIRTCALDLVDSRGWMSNSQIATELGVSREQARRMVNSAMASAEAADGDVGGRLRAAYEYSKTIKGDDT